MGLNISKESLTPIEFRDLTQQEERYLQRQVYYFFPFLRTTYEFLRRGELDDQSKETTLIIKFKELAEYYAGAFVFGEFDLRQEQQIIDRLFTETRMTKNKFKDDLLFDREYHGVNRSNASDGEIKDYFFGERLCIDIFDQTGQEYNMRSGGGLITLSAESRRKLLLGLGKFIGQNRKIEEKIAIWGNVARGVIDGAAINLFLNQIGVPSEYHLYRMSSQAYQDERAFSIGENPIVKNTWAIGVDSMSGGGASVPSSVDFLRELGFNRVSFFLTFCGFNQIKRYPVEYQWDAYSNNEVGTLFCCQNKLKS